MRHNIIGKAVAGLAAIAMMSSCASDYLDTKPISSVSTNTVTSNITAAKSTYYGIIEGMNMLYSIDDGYMILNGEAWLNIYHGEDYGQDDFIWFWCRSSIGPYIVNWNGMNYGAYWMSQFCWSYCYTLINYSNGLLAGIDDMEGDDADKKMAQYYKAGALTIRAHAYTKLLQVYGPRWEDSNDGTEDTVVLRTAQTTEDLPLAPMNDVLDQIYADLDEAIALFEASGAKRPTGYIWEPNIDVAKGVYSRAALLKHDYAKAQQMAHDARQNYPIMSGDQYKAGFNAANQEWMWGNIHDDMLGYYQFASVYGCNGAYPCIWANIGAGAINYDLYRQIPEGDIRRDLFFTPDKNFRFVWEEDFWDPEQIVASNMNINYRSTGMKTELEKFGKQLKPDASWPDAYSPVEGQTDADAKIYVPFGAQFKFWGCDKYGTGQYPFMRAAELLFNEAEAAQALGDEATARKCLEEINSLRQQNYTCTASGDALRDEIRLYRRIELWGEGFNWFDLKRWNIPMVRKPWIENDINSNNIPDVYAITKQPSDNNGWRFAVPMGEYQYNSLINANGNVKTVSRTLQSGKNVKPNGIKK